MPSHAALSSRDGRARSSSIQSSEPTDAPYYTNEEIELLHEVVTLGQELLPTLPKRDQLPTTALFRAADTVFPQHGLDPDGEDRLNRVIFLVGGMRTSDDLLDRFAIVLRRMGIELEYVNQDDEQGRHDQQEQQDQHNQHSVPSLHASPPSIYSASTSSASFVYPAQPSEPPRPQRVNSRRRRNSFDTTAHLAEIQQPHDRPGQLGQPARRHQRRRSDSSAPPVNHNRLTSADSTRPIDPWLSQLPPYPGKGHHEEDMSDAEDAENVEGGVYEEGDVHSYPNDQEPDTNHLDAYTRSLEQLGLPAARHHIQAHDHDPMETDNGKPLPRHLHSLPYRARELPDPTPYPIQPAHSSTEAQSPRSGLSLATYSEGFPGASDTTIQDDLEDGPPPKVDPVIMAKVADTYFMRFTFLGGLAVDTWRTICATHMEQEQYAVAMDRELSASEAVLMWSEVAGTHPREATRTTDQQQQAPEAEADADDENEENDQKDDADSEVSGEATRTPGGQLLEQRGRIMKMAARAYDISIMSKAMTHWQVMAHEETERTKVARRHLLRKKVFGAWRGQTVHDEARVGALTLRWSVQNWAKAAAKAQEEQQLACRVYNRDLATVKFWTWFRVHQEQTSVSWRNEQLKKTYLDRWRKGTRARATAEANSTQFAADDLLWAAASHWMVETQSMAMIQRHVKEQENDRLCSTALRDWSKLTFLAGQLRTMQSAQNAELKEIAVNVWRQATTAAREQTEQIDRSTARDYANHWVRETELSLYSAEEDHRLKVEAVHDWILVEKLAFYQRYREEQLLWKSVLQLQAAYDDQQQNGEALCSTAEHLSKTNTVCNVVSAMQRQKQEHHAQSETADAVDRGSLAVKALGALSVDAAKHAEMDSLARRGAYYVSVTNALSGWADYAKKEREARLRATYHGFRRSVKRATAAGCIGAWVAATDECLAGEETADAVRADSENDALFSTLNNWILQTNDCLFQETAAIEANAEVYLSRWRLELEQHDDANAIAAEHDAATQLTGRWDDWELQATQARAWHHTAEALHEKSNRRLGRKVLSAWHQLAVASDSEDDIGAAANNFEDDDDNNYYRRYEDHLALTSTPRYGARADRWDMGSSLSRYGAASQPRHRPDEPRSRANFLLHPIMEHGAATAAQTPVTSRRPFLSSSVASTAVAGGTQPRRLHRSAAAAPGRQGRRRTPYSLGGAPAASEDYGEDTSPPDRAPPQHYAASVPAFRRTPTAARHTTTGGASSASGHASQTRQLSLLQQRLQSASQLAESVQLGPMPEFDETAYDLDEEEGGGGDADVDMEDEDNGDNGADGDNSSEGEPVLPSSRRHSHRKTAAASTPRANTTAMYGQEPEDPQTRPQPAARPLRRLLQERTLIGRGGAVAATTTPMAPLPSPFERRLRAAYRASQDEEDDMDAAHDGRLGERLGERLPNRLSRLAETPVQNASMRASMRSSTARVTFAERERRF